MWRASVQKTWNSALRPARRAKTMYTFPHMPCCAVPCMVHCMCSCEARHACHAVPCMVHCMCSSPPTPTSHTIIESLSADNELLIKSFLQCSHNYGKDHVFCFYLDNSSLLGRTSVALYLLDLLEGQNPC